MVGRNTSQYPKPRRENVPGYGVLQFEGDGKGKRATGSNAGSPRSELCFRSRLTTTIQTFNADVIPSTATPAVLYGAERVRVGGIPREGAQ